VSRTVVWRLCGYGGEGSRLLGWGCRVDAQLLVAGARCIARAKAQARADANAVSRGALNTAASPSEASVSSRGVNYDSHQTGGDGEPDVSVSPAKRHATAPAPGDAFGSTKNGCCPSHRAVTSQEVISQPLGRVVREFNRQQTFSLDQQVISVDQQAAVFDQATTACSKNKGEVPNLTAESEPSKWHLTGDGPISETAECVQVSQGNVFLAAEALCSVITNGLEVHWEEGVLGLTRATPAPPPFAAVYRCVCSMKRRR
jgi:hypothetical protein